ncbi:MAG: carboxymuconolactone decarboxylase family protein [Mycobacteriales bacterium]
MQARMNHPAFVVPGAMDALQALSKADQRAGVPMRTLELIKLRASQINGCGVCLEMHTRDLRKMGETDERLATLAGWPDAPYFSDAERAALALTEAVTRLADRSDAVPDHVWNAAAEHYDEKQLAGLLLAIAGINVWNRLNVATRTPAGVI